MNRIVRSENRRVTAYRPSTELVPEILEGNRASIARMITRAEGAYAEAEPALAQLYKHSGKAHIVGITGVPGAGKSTLVSALIKAFTADGYKVGVVAVDPSSPYSGGAILGDRVRMSDAAEANQAFVRSMATRGNLGGLARSTLEAVDILDAAGYSPVIIETVGVGQDEVEVVSAAHTVVVLSAPGLGDDIQAIKAGILEIADIHSVSKSDKPEAAATVSALKGMMALGTVRTDTSWPAPIVPISSVSGEGIHGLKDMILDHWKHLQDSGELEARQRNMCKTRILGTAKHLFYQKFEEDAQGLAGQLQAVMDRDDDPFHAAHVLLGWDHEGSQK